MANTPADVPDVVKDLGLYDDMDVDALYGDYNEDEPKTPEAPDDQSTAVKLTSEDSKPPPAQPTTKTISQTAAQPQPQPQPHPQQHNSVQQPQQPISKPTPPVIKTVNPPAPPPQATNSTINHQPSSHVSQPKPTQPASLPHVPQKPTSPQHTSGFLENCYLLISLQQFLLLSMKNTWNLLILPRRRYSSEI